jgi:3-deoxy-D-manno-octulosonic-acid transferase
VINYLWRVQRILYNIFLFLYVVAIRIAFLFNAKARKWIRGRRDIIQVIKSTLPHNEERIWIHCSSLGEFEQGRPLIDSIKKDHPHKKIVLTFFSPSGYEVRKDYEHADYVFYLPMDGCKTAARFIRAVNPALAIFVKYEFWYHYLRTLRKSNIPTIIIAAAFRPSQPFFHKYGSFFRKMLQSFTYFFVQDQASKDLLATIGYTDNVIVAGDTRYDRVAEIAATAPKMPEVETFVGASKILIAGSTWPDDEKLLASCLSRLPGDWKMIIAPHEVHQAHIQQVKELFSWDGMLYSELQDKPIEDKRVLIIDNIGMLSSLYQYGEIAYVGGGFQKGGIHNVLEPAVFGLPVIFGPIYQKFVEANLLVSKGFAFPVKDSDEAQTLFSNMIPDKPLIASLHQQIKAFVSEQRGATEKILSAISEAGLLK